MSKEENDTDRLTFERSEEEYGPDYQSHLMELYKFYAGQRTLLAHEDNQRTSFF